MELKVLRGKDAILNAVAMVEEFLDNADECVFFLTGNPGVGKKTAVERMLKERGFKYVKYSKIICNELIFLQGKIQKHPDAVHLWNDVDEHNIMKEDVLNFIYDLLNKKEAFSGKLIIVANDDGFQDKVFPELNGTWIQMTNHDVLDYIGMRLEAEKNNQQF